MLVVHKEFFQYLIEDQRCPSSDDFRKMYWVGSFYLLIINIESYQRMISSGSWITVTCLCPYLPNTDFFPGDSLRSYQGWAGGVLAKTHSAIDLVMQLTFVLFTVVNGLSERNSRSTA